MVMQTPAPYPEGDEVEALTDFDEDHHITMPIEPLHRDPVGLVFGTPFSDGQYWHHQTSDFNCAVEAQNAILECLTGEKVSEVEAAVESAQLGVLTTSGTLPDHIGTWLEHRGIECHANDNGTFLDVLRELRDGNKVIMGVDSTALWHSNDALSAFASQAKDHAIWLTGVDASDPDHVKVYINDSGKPDGAANVYDLNELSEVLNSPGFNYVATGAGPSYLPEEPEGYNAETGVFDGLNDFIATFAVPTAGLAAGLAAAAVDLRSGKRRRDQRITRETSEQNGKPLKGRAAPPPSLPAPPLRLEDQSNDPALGVPLEGQNQDNKGGKGLC